MSVNLCFPLDIDNRWNNKALLYTEFWERILHRKIERLFLKMNIFSESTQSIKQYLMIGLVYYESRHTYVRTRIMKKGIVFIQTNKSIS